MTDKEIFEIGRLLVVEDTEFIFDLDDFKEQIKKVIKEYGVGSVWDVISNWEKFMEEENDVVKDSIEYLKEGAMKEAEYEAKWRRSSYDEMMELYSIYLENDLLVFWDGVYTGFKERFGREIDEVVEEILSELIV